jgi:hypothetical protein
MMNQHAAAWKLERTLWRMPVVRPKDEVVGEVMRQIRTSFVPKALIASEIEKLRIPGVSNEDITEPLAVAYNKALDGVMASLVDSHK